MLVVKYSVMKDAHNLPSNIAKLQDMVRLRDEEIDILREQVRSLKHSLFGPKSEALHQDVVRDQVEMFELETAEDLTDETDKGDAEDESSSEPRPKRRGKRLPIPTHLPREEVVHDLTHAEKQCGCGHEKACIGKDSTEVLERRSQYVVKVLSRLKYACKNPDCEAMLLGEPGTVTIAKPFPRMIPKSLAGDSLLAHVVTSKFVDGLPLYRIEKQFKREGLRLSRQTMSRWMQILAEQMEPLWDLLQGQIKAHPYLQMDETTFQVLGEDGRKNQTKSYLWAIRGGPPGQPIILFRYFPTRASDVIREWLADYQGIVQTDGYKGYDFLDGEDGISHAACWVHARRKFVQVVKAAGKKGKKGRAGRILKVLRDIYRLEAAYQGKPFDEIAAMRGRELKPKLNDLHEVLQDLQGKTPPSGLLGKAVSYTLKQWPRLQVFLDHGEMKPDTNDVENAIRPFVVGRKGWLFAGSPGGAKASAILYSMMETAKANGWNPTAWLQHVFEHLPKAETVEDRLPLLPNQKPPLAESA